MTIANTRKNRIALQIIMAVAAVTVILVFSLGAKAHLGPGPANRLLVSLPLAAGRDKRSSS